MSARRAAVRAYAKLNLMLRVLHKRADNFHELRTVFQTISLHDDLELEFRTARRRDIVVECSVAIPDNIVVRAASMMLDEMRINGQILVRLHKRIPMGGGLGGGSTDAAAILMALPVLAGKGVDAVRVHGIAASLGSDVPFFLYGGTALGLSRGEELYPFPEPARSYGVLIAPGIHVSTPEAYRALGRDASPQQTPVAGSFGVPARASVVNWGTFCRNDFEAVVFDRHPVLARIKRKLKSQGASVAMMTGSGSSMVGFFESREAALRVQRAWVGSSAHLFHTLNRAQYQAAWFPKPAPGLEAGS